MKKKIKLFPTFILVLTVFLLTSSCVTDAAKTNDSTSDEDSFAKTLTEVQIGKSNYYISIPAGYSIKESEGPDFSVYRILPTDTALKPTFTCGLYFGNYPNQFEPANDSCKSETQKSKILGTTPDWTVYNCNGEYSVQTIVDSKSGERWNSLIHAFGRAKSNTDLTKVFNIHATLHQKK